ncbi:bifunctional diguanylate cyclase/phosphodiesterase [Aquibacillus rhizosphaerae]|uniref:EAL domain-containing protein n=1 Tax=Aquibacillus rhizosphaerae TaxID=3051431 RepID=A0ABT7L5Q6_9BACI|nr:EAL domain-containing protein [Aquibacillus sp. LR5S19]MDL4840532.1 EAL domain-containing protein [Aquibacillus sp. LR5S19]
MFNIPENMHQLDGDYSIPVVILSVVIACCASYASISMNQRIQQNSFFKKSFWLLLASLAMGLGIWSMHFIGMSAFMLPIPMEYDLLLTIISVFPAIAASYLAFFIANRGNHTNFPYAIAGLFMGIGISSMHYIGMTAMKMEASYSYKPLLFFASIIIAILASNAALFIFSALQKYMGNLLIKAVTSLVMGLAITSMHYTGMAAVVFYVEEPIHTSMDHLHGMDMSLLITFVTLGISILLIISGLTSLLDRYVDYRLTYYDSLTLLQNQRQFEKDMDKKTLSGSLAILHIHNMEKWISGEGYSFGDELIKVVGETIQRLKPNSSVVYRIEGNRFAILVNEDHSYEEMKLSLERILSVFKMPFTIGNASINIESVCSVSTSQDNQDIKQSFANCMAVLRHQSVTYKHEVIEYDASVHTYSLERQLVNDVQQAMEKNELFLVYQPKVCTKTMQVTGLEALLRWNHPQHGLISPGVFIPVFESNGKIFEVTDWVIEAVCKQISKWVLDDTPFVQVAINIPGAYITSLKLQDAIERNLNKYKLAPNLIELEITETSVINDIENAINAVHKFSSFGIPVALDDFGTGLSSLSYLRRIPISTIKIDKTFVDYVPESKKDSDVLNAIITLCSSLHLNIVIEGIETTEQFSYIKSDVAADPAVQGYFFSKPLTVTEITDWLRERTHITT